jgi:hypothetical protein
MMHMGNNMCSMNLVMKGKLKPQAVNPNMPMMSVENRRGRRGKSRRSKSRRSKSRRSKSRRSKSRRSKNTIADII